jgi:hypothetical protein
MPTLPLFNTVNNVVVAEAVELAIVKRGEFEVSEVFLWIESWEYGEVVPMPTLPVFNIVTAGVE